MGGYHRYAQPAENGRDSLSLVGINRPTLDLGIVEFGSLQRGVKGSESHSESAAACPSSAVSVS